MKFSTIAAALLMFITAAAAEVNLLPNATLKSKDGHLPDGWSGLRGKEQIKAYQTENGVLRISGKTANYVSYTGATIDVEPGRSYYLALEMKSDLLSHNAAIFYTVRDAQRKVLVNSRPLLRRYTGPQPDWVKIGFIIPVGSLPTAAKLSISFGVYNPSRKVLAEDKAIYFRNIKLTYFNGQKTILPPAPRRNAANSAMPDNPFSRHNFTGSSIGTSYLLEKNGVGFFRLDTGTMPRQNVIMSVKHPQGVKSELYLWKRSGRECTLVAGKNNRYVINRSYDWLIWSNCLIFTADASVPEKFNIDLEFECAGKKISFTIPVQQVAAFPAGKLPEQLRYNSWQSFPVTRINTENPQHTLAKKLSDYWKNSGWLHTPYVEIVNAIPFAWRANTLKVRQGVDPAGTPVTLFCDSSWIAAGSDYFADYLKKIRFAPRIAAAEYVKWDYEPYTKGPVTMSCFCKECIQSFAQKNGLPATVSGIEIIKNHKKAWVDFRCRQRAEVVRTIVGAIKKINPRAKFELCTMPIAPQNDDEYEETYGIRSTLYNDIVDLFTSMNYASNLNFFRSIEREALELGKEKRTLISNGWTRGNNGSRLAFQLLAAFFCGEKYPYIAQGLFVSNGEQLRELRKVMDFVARTEKSWSQGKFIRSSRKVFEGFNASGNFYILERKDNRKSWALIFNNSERDTLFAKLAYDSKVTGSITDLDSGKVLIGKNDMLTVKMAPLSYQLLEFSPEKKSGAVQNNFDAEEKALLEFYQKKNASGKKYGMSYELTGDRCVIITPAQQLTFDLRNSGEASWRVKGKSVAHTLGRDIFMDKGVFNLNKRTVDVESVVIERNAIKFRYAFTIKEAPYTGLVLRREYTILRNTPEIQAYIEIVPQGGFRNFRLRTVNNFAMKRLLNPNAVVSQVSSGKVADKNLFHIGFVRKNAKFPNKQPFFAPRYMKKTYPLTADTFAIAPADGAYSVELSAQNVDQVFVWRSRESGSVEFIWPDAYPRYDPHLIATWKTFYTMKFIEK